MTVYRQILVPVQEPAEVEPLVRFAAMLLDADGLIRVLHVIPSTTLPEVTREWRASVHMVVPAHEAGAALDVRVDPEVRAATDVPGEILESAESHNVDAILLTLRGSRTGRKLFVGHTATGVLHHARADVVVLNRLMLVTDRIPRILLPALGEAPSAKVRQIAEAVSGRNSGVPVIPLPLGSRETGTPSESGGTAPRQRSAPSRRGFFPGALLGRRRHQLAEEIVAAAARERFGLVIVGERSDPSGGPLLTRRFLEELFRAAPCPVVAVAD